MKKIILSLSLLFYAAHGFAQLRIDKGAGAKDSLLVFIEKLNTESFGIIPNYATYHTYFDRNARSIIKILTEDKSNRTVLLNYLRDKEKAVAIHAILTKLYDSSKFHVEIETIFEKEPRDINTKTIGDRYWLNGIQWELRNSPNGDYLLTFFVAEDEIIKIEKFWRRRFYQSKTKHSGQAKSPKPGSSVPPRQ